VVREAEEGGEEEAVAAASGDVEEAAGGDFRLMVMARRWLSMEMACAWAHFCGIVFPGVVGWTEKSHMLRYGATV